MGHICVEFVPRGADKVGGSEGRIHAGRLRGRVQRRPAPTLGRRPLRDDLGRRASWGLEEHVER